MARTPIRKKYACRFCGRTFDVKRVTAVDTRGNRRWYYVCAVCDWSHKTGRMIYGDG